MMSRPEPKKEDSSSENEPQTVFSMSTQNTSFKFIVEDKDDESEFSSLETDSTKVTQDADGQKTIVHQHKYSLSFKSIFGYALLPPLMILMTRMQSLDFTYHRHLFKTLKDMVIGDKLHMLYRGVPSILFGQAFLWVGCTLAAEQSLKPQPFYVVQDRPKASRLGLAYYFGIFYASCLICHPFQVMGMQVQYARFNQTKAE